MTTPFETRVLTVVRMIPPGTVTTYGFVATLCGTPRAARAVGSVLRRCVAEGDEVPWQRVINAKAQISFKGDLVRAAIQRRLLESEGITFDETGCVCPERWWSGRGAPDYLRESALSPGVVPRDFSG